MPREPAAMASRTSTGLVPLTDLPADDRYKGEDGGLYGEGRNEPPEAHLKLALAVAGEVRPLDVLGQPADDGAVVMVSIGMSNTTQSFARFVELAEQDAAKSPCLRLADGAQNGRDGLDWALADYWFDSPATAPWHPWTRLAARLAAVPVTPLQVQVAWIKLARKTPERLGDFPAHARVLHADYALTVLRLKRTFPNLRLAYLSSRTYAGYATTRLNPEPYAYEGAFPVRWLILDQIRGRPELNPDPARGRVQAPVLLWGPYLWADGLAPRRGDGLTWEAGDMEADGTHPSTAGRQQVAELLLRFCHTDPTARGWYLRASKG